MAKSQKCIKSLCRTNFYESHPMDMWVIHKGWQFMPDAECICSNSLWILKSVHSGSAAMVMLLGKPTHSVLQINTFL